MLCVSSNIFPSDTTYFSDLFQKQENYVKNKKAGCTSEIFAKNISGKGVIQNIQTTLKN